MIQKQPAGTHSKASKEFIDSEQKGGLLLAFCVVISLIVANTPIISQLFFDFLHLKWAVSVGNFKLEHTTEHWINDGLMGLFFLLVGIEIKREILKGELSSLKQSMLPIAAAMGGMIVPSLIYAFFNHGSIFERGWAIPMATDIAFALAILSMLGKRVPISLKIFLTALAIVDDLGSVVIIAIFYSSHLSLFYLGMAAIVFALLILLNRIQSTLLWMYIILGGFLWFFILKSGVHATIAGVLVAFAAPLNARKGKYSPAERLEHYLHAPVTFFILPLFALANTAVVLTFNVDISSFAPLSLGIALGLLIGKPLGIFIFSRFAVSMGWASLPVGITWGQILAVGILGGIGFTMSIFITLLSLSSPEAQSIAKISILVSSVVAAMLGYWLLARKSSL